MRLCLDETSNISTGKQTNHKATDGPLAFSPRCSCPASATSPSIHLCCVTLDIFPCLLKARSAAPACKQLSRRA